MYFQRSFSHDKLMVVYWGSSYNPLPPITKELLSWTKAVTRPRFWGLTASAEWPYHLQLLEEVQTRQRPKATHTEGTADLAVDIPSGLHMTLGSYLTCFWSLVISSSFPPLSRLIKSCLSQPMRSAWSLTLLHRAGCPFPQS